jgi:hypothetical protein
VITQAVRRALLVLGAASLAWSAVTALTGGFAVDLGAIPLSSRNPRNPLLLGVSSLVLAWLAAPSGRRKETLSKDFDALFTRTSAASRRAAAGVFEIVTPARVSALLAIAVAAIGIQRGALVAGGSDSYGYLSQARLWTSGSLRVEQPLLQDPPAGIPAEALAPLGYRLSPDRSALVPVFPPGLPMLMACVSGLAGERAAFYVMPLLAGLAVWLTYVLGATVGGRATGLAAALLLAASPAFAFQLTHAPMSDIPAGAWWSLSLVLAATPSGAGSLLSGFAAAIGILTRPNLVPLAIVPALVIFKSVRRAHARRPPWEWIAMYAAGAVPGALVVAWLNDHWYGSPLASGYGQLAGTFYRWEHLWANLARYPRWLADSQTPLVFTSVAAPLFVRALGGPAAGPTAGTVLGGCAGLVVLTFACYVFYLPFDAWWFLRFLLPAYPALMVLTAAALLGACARLPRPARLIAGTALVLVIVLHGIGYGRRNSAFDSSSEWRFAEAGQLIAARLPESTVLLAMNHSGSARYYSGRLTIRYDHIPPDRLDAVVQTLEARGYSAMILLDVLEEAQFRERFRESSPLGALDWTPVATIAGVNLYDARLPR